VRLLRPPCQQTGAEQSSPPSAKSRSGSISAVPQSPRYVRSLRDSGGKTDVTAFQVGPKSRRPCCFRQDHLKARSPDYEGRKCCSRARRAEQNYFPDRTHRSCFDLISPRMLARLPRGMVRSSCAHSRGIDHASQRTDVARDVHLASRLDARCGRDCHACHRTRKRRDGAARRPLPEYHAYPGARRASPHAHWQRLVRGASRSRREDRMVRVQRRPEREEAVFAKSIDLTYVGPNPAINVYFKSNGGEGHIIAGGVNGGSALVAAGLDPEYRRRLPRQEDRHTAVR